MLSARGSDSGWRRWSSSSDTGVLNRVSVISVFGESILSIYIYLVCAAVYQLSCATETQSGSRFGIYRSAVSSISLAS
jgi:hypothetical protein